jgi:hypothetical protein
MARPLEQRELIGFVTNYLYELLMHSIVKNLQKMHSLHSHHDCFWISACAKNFCCFFAQISNKEQSYGECGL